MRLRGVSKYSEYHGKEIKYSETLNIMLCIDREVRCHFLI